MRRKFLGALGVLFSLLFASAPAFAHHSPAAEFTFKKTVTIKGTISSVEWINPHVYVHLDAKDASGKVTSWNFETHPTRFLHKAGVTKEMLLGPDGEGQAVSIDAFPAKDGSKDLGFIQKITFPDGHFFVLWSPADNPDEAK
jgi:hypothetical protein